MFETAVMNGFVCMPELGYYVIMILVFVSSLVLGYLLKCLELNKVDKK